MILQKNVMKINANFLMNMSRKFRIIFVGLLLFIILPSRIFPQAGFEFLLIPPSPTMNGLGGIGSCLPSDDPFAGFYNPANGLQNFKGISFAHSKMNTAWLVSRFHFKYEVWNLGIVPEKYPIQIVLSGHNNYFESLRDDYNTKANALSLGLFYSGVLFTLPIEFSIGYTSKTAEQNFRIGLIGGQTSNGQEFYSTSDKFYDYGLLVSFPFPLKKLKNEKYKSFNDAFDVSIKPSFGYSVSNIGDSVGFGGYLHDPTPKYLRTGFSLSAALMHNKKINIIEWQGGRSVSDYLIAWRTDSQDPIKYKSGFGDFNFVNHIVLGQADTLVTVHHGGETTIMEMISIRKGRRIDVRGRMDRITKGYGIKSSGLFKMLHNVLDDPLFQQIPEFIDIQYNYSEWFEERTDTENVQEFKSLTITLNNLDRLLIWLFN